MLLDTHIVLWFARGVNLSQDIRRIITEARNDQGVYVSAATVWEIGNLIRKGRAEIDVTLAEWLNGFLNIGGFRTIELSTEIVIAADSLPGRFHSDPADRFLVATARHLYVPMVTRDRRILNYAKAGHLKAIRG